MLIGIYFLLWALHGYSIIYSTAFKTKFGTHEMSYFFQIACRLSYIWTPLLATIYDRRFQVKKSFNKILASRPEGSLSKISYRDGYHSNLVA